MRSNAPATYRSIIDELEKATCLTLEFDQSVDQDQVQKRLSQAKVRLGVEGKLSFAWTRLEGKGWELSLVLHPQTSASIAPLAGPVKRGL